MVTGITPQQTVADGVTESELCRLLVSEVFTPNTIAIGYNNIRFDDEFIRHLFWRNFYDPYEWLYKDGRSRWDMLDVARMTRAFRPDGIKWPVDDKGEAVNKLELISKENGINHFKAHDAISDVEALMAITRLIRSQQPQLFDFLFKIRDKNEVKKLVNLDDKKPFVYSSGRYESQFNKTTVAFPLTSSRNGNVVVYDLRYDPTPFMKMNSKELAKKLFASREERSSDDFIKLPVKELQYNRAPAVAPLGVLGQADGWAKISLDSDTVNKHEQILLSSPDFAENIRSVYESREEYAKSLDAEAQLYEGFVPDIDKIRVELIRNSNENELADLHPNFSDERLSPLLLHYKARNYPKSLSADEVEIWEKWRSDKILSALPSYMDSLQKLSAKATDDNTSFLLQELQLWAESIVPSE